VLSDVQMARASGLEVLAAVTKQFPDTPHSHSAYAEPGAAMDAIASGAADYLAKPVDVVALRATVAGAMERRRLAAENRSLRSAIAGRKLLVGTSAAMLELYKQIAQVAPTEATVLITGESGSARSWSRGLSTSAAAVPSIPLSRLAAPRWPRGFSKASCSVTSAAPSQVPVLPTRDCSKPPRGAPFFWMRSGTSRARCRASCCGFCRKARCGGWAALRSSR